MGQDIEFLKKIWHLLIAHGAVCKCQEWSGNPDPIEYYTGSFNADKKATEEALKHIIHHGIDYGNCSDIKDGTDAAFTDTFNDSIEVPYLMGVLATKNGKRYHWGTKSCAITLPVMMKLLSSDMVIEDSITSLQTRLSANKYDCGDGTLFNRSCELES